MSSDTETNSIYPNFDTNKENKSSFSTYPHFLFPSKQIPLALASHRPATTDHLQSINFIQTYNVSHHGINDYITSTKLEHANRKNFTMHHNTNNNNHHHNNNDEQNNLHKNNYQINQNKNNNNDNFNKQHEMDVKQIGENGLTVFIYFLFFSINLTRRDPSR